MGKKKPRLDYGKIANALGAGKMEPKNRASTGLEIVFNTPLDRKPHRVGYFPFECIDSCDLKQKKIILAPDYRVWKGLESSTFFFNSAAPNRPIIVFIPQGKIVSIRRLSNGKVLYQENDPDVMPENW